MRIRSVWRYFSDVLNEITFDIFINWKLIKSKQRMKRKKICITKIKIS